MLFRKLYLKTKLYLYSKRKTLNKIAVVSMLTVLVYLFLNNILFGKLILNQAHCDQAIKKYDNAIIFYDIAYCYYSINHYSRDNKKKFFEISYDTATCYMKKHDKEKAFKIMLDNLTMIQQSYGFFSWETAYYSREYLIEFYLDNQDNVLAYKEINNLLLIQKKIGYDNNEMADIIRICGDLYYQQKKYDTAIDLYDKAYTIISEENSINYEIFAKIVDRICDYDVYNYQIDKAVALYEKSIETLRRSGEKQNELMAQMLIKLGDLYNSDSYSGKSLKSAIVCYEEAIEIIKKLPNATEIKQNIIPYLKTLKGLYGDDSQYYVKSREIEIELARQRRFSVLF